MKELNVILMALLCLSLSMVVHAETSSSIPQSEIEKVELSFRAVFSEATNTLKRRAFKRVVRRANSLVKKYPDSAERFRVLSIIFKCQQNLMMINNTKETREDVFATARELVKAPIKHSKFRLQADILLLRAKISPRSVTLEERVKAIKDLAEVYLESESEASCLMYLIMVAKDLKSHQLFNELKVNLSTRFTKDPEVSAFMRQRFSVSKRDLRFRGMFRTLDSKLISFPTDIVGHNTMVCFWSTSTPELKSRFEEIKSYQEKTNGNFKVFSFNIDELEDAGQSILTENDCDWLPMRLPNGKRSKAFLGFGHKKFKYTLLPMNAFGYSLGKTYNAHTKHDSDVDVFAILNDPQYLALMKALSSGQFLISSSSQYKTKELESIVRYFPSTQRHYRLRTAERISNYKNIIKECDEKLKNEAGLKEAWKVINCKTIALLGLWKEQISNENFDLALAEAKRVLEIEGLPIEAKIIPNFVIAKHALRQNKDDAVKVVETFLESCGGQGAPANAYATAGILSVDGGQDTRELFHNYRKTIYQKHISDASIEPITEFLFKENNSFTLFQANEKRYYFGYTSIYKQEYGGFSIARAYTDRKIKANFETLNGRKLNIPDGKEYHYHLCHFLDLPKGVEAEVELVNYLKGIKSTVGEARRKDMKQVLFFLSQDTAAIKEFISKYSLNIEAVSLKGGVDNPILNQCGVFSPERFVNTVLIAPNGAFLVNYSKLHHKPTVLHRHDKDKSDWFDCLSVFRVSTVLKRLVTLYDKKMGDFYFYKANGHLVDLFDKGSCCINAYARGWKGCKNDCCRKAASQKKVCLKCNPDAKGKQAVPPSINDWRRAARHYALTFNDDKQMVSHLGKNLKIALQKSQDYHAMLAFATEAIKTHRKPQYGIYRYPHGLYAERARIYDLLGDRAKANADRKTAAELKKKDDETVANHNQAKQKAKLAAQKKKADEIKAAKERIKKLNEERAKNSKK